MASLSHYLNYSGRTLLVECSQYDIVTSIQKYIRRHQEFLRPNLRPPLFFLFINDIVEHISSEKLLFADDLKLFIETTTDYCRILQTNINTVVEWFNTNPFSLNKKKCFAVSYTKKQDPIIFNYAKRLLIWTFLYLTRLQTLFRYC